MIVRKLGFSVVILGVVMAYIIICMVLFEQQPLNHTKELGEPHARFPMNADGSIVLGTEVGDDGVVRSRVIPK